MKSAHRLAIIAILFFSTACQAGGEPNTPIPSAEPTATRVVLQPSATVQAPTTTPDPTDTPIIAYWMDESLVAEIRQKVCLPADFKPARTAGEAAIHIEAGSSGNLAIRQVFVLAGKFSTLEDGISLDEFRQAWQGTGSWKLAAGGQTEKLLESSFGIPSNIRIASTVEELISTAWAEPKTLVIVPFDQLEPRLKVLSLDGISPLDKDMNIDRYPLKADFSWQGEALALETWAKSCPVVTNRDESQMTDVLMTGVTALTRGTAAKMAEKGITYPAEGILDWLRSADFTHISNEVSFYSSCPPPLPLRAGGRFCSQPDFLKLLTYAGVDIVELTGNHLNDWGTGAFNESLAIYQQAGLLTFGGGADAEQARQPLLVEKNGNKLAFIGCNSMGPQEDWATDTQPGSAKCDLDWLAGEVRQFKVQGYLPIVSFQGFEVCEFKPHSTQREAAAKMVEAGAVIVNGSQAHCPQMYDLQGSTFIHYGLGNLWFDQMDWITRQELLDRHIFYAGRHISTQVYTAILEDSARPRPMTPAERQRILELLFQVSGW